MGNVRKYDWLLMPDGTLELLDPDLRQTVEEAEAGRAQLKAREPVDTRRALMNFEVELTRQLAFREQVRRDGVLSDDGYDVRLVAAEAAVQQIWERLVDSDMADGNITDARLAYERLERGVVRVRADRDRSLAEGWAYEGERRWLAVRETQWEKAVKRAGKRLRRH